MERLKHSAKKNGLGVKELLTELITQRVEQVFGETASRVLIDHLKRNHHLLIEDIYERSEVFSAGLGEVLGAGAKMLERLVLKDLYSNLGLDYREKEGYKLSDYLKELSDLR